MPETTWTSPEGKEYLVEYSICSDEINFRPVLALDSVDAMFDDEGWEVDLDGVAAKWFEQHKESIFAACNQAIDELDLSEDD